MLLWYKNTIVNMNHVSCVEKVGTNRIIVTESSDINCYEIGFRTPEIRNTNFDAFLKSWAAQDKLFHFKDADLL